MRNACGGLAQPPQQRPGAVLPSQLGKGYLLISVCFFFFFFPCLGQHCSCFALEVGSELGEVCWTAGLVVILIQVAPTEASPL